jgi:maltose phosphorylase
LPETLRLLFSHCFFNRLISNDVMNQYLQHDAWSIIESGFDPAHNLFCESCFSIGNGRMGQRANFEEQYSGPSVQGSYLAGFHILKHPEPGIQKMGFPAAAAASVNAPNWIGIDIHVNGEVLDLATCKLKGFRRVLDMKKGLLERSFTAKLVSGNEIKVQVTRFCSLKNRETGAIRYTVKPLNFEGTITVMPYLDGDVRNSAEPDEIYWTGIDQQVKKHSGYLVVETRKTEHRACVGMKFHVFKNKQKVDITTAQQVEDRFISCSASVKCKTNDNIVVYKYAGVVSSFYHEKTKLVERCRKVVGKAYKSGFDKLLKKHTAAWAARWAESDVVVEGDVAAQQTIRFNIFQLLQSFAGDDDRLNIAPKGFTGEQNPGATWAVEAFCLPFYLANYRPKVARNLLLYRHRQLPEAIENAARLGISGGAALFPASTMTGTETGNDGDVSLRGIHRNGAVALAIFNYIRFTGDREYLTDYGLEVLIAIARFWANRVHWSHLKQAYVLHGVTGPNEYETNVNNNWYTNYLAVWCLKYALETLEWVEKNAPQKCEALLLRLNFDRTTEIAHWEHIAGKMYFPKVEPPGIILQQEDFLDKELYGVDTLRTEERPLYRHWSWDRLQRSCFIQQADVLLGFYFFENHFNREDLLRHFEFYEPMTVHEDNFSAAVHAILAARLGKYEKAVDWYRHIARLDLQNTGGDTADGLHIINMAGAWLTLVEGFGGMRVEEEMLSFAPFLPHDWEAYVFKVKWRGYSIRVSVSKESITILNETMQHLTVKLNGKVLDVEPESEVKA